MYDKIRIHIKKLVLSALFMALCLLLPFITGQIQKIGQMLAPMHIPVMLCGIVCGPLWGAVVGFTAPLLRYMLFGMPIIYPMGISMAFELATYGLVIGLLYMAFGNKKWGSIASLLGAMLCGIVCGPLWGAVVGFTAPLLRYMFFGMPIIYPMGISMAFELLVYGLVIGLLYMAFGNKKWGSIVSLFGAMICGRAVWGMVRLILAGLKSTQFTAAMFISGAFTTAIPGIICQMILIPLIVALLKRFKLIPIK